MTTSVKAVDVGGCWSEGLGCVCYHNATVFPGLDVSTRREAWWWRDDDLGLFSSRSTWMLCRFYVNHELQSILEMWSPVWRLKPGQHNEPKHSYQSTTESMEKKRIGAYLKKTKAMLQRRAGQNSPSKMYKTSKVTQKMITSCKCCWRCFYKLLAHRLYLVIWKGSFSQHSMQWCENFIFHMTAFHSFSCSGCV